MSCMKLETLDTHRARIGCVLAYIQDHLDDDLRLETLARRGAISTFHFHRLFREIVGEAPMTYVRRLRLDRAATALMYTSASIQRIARRAGYETHESFTRAFHRAFGASPSVFRRRASPAAPSPRFEFSIERLERRTLAFLPRVGPYDEVGLGIAELQDWAAPRGLLEEAEPLGVYRDDQAVTPPTHTRYEAALLVSDDATQHGEVRVRTLPDRDYAIVRLDGSPPTALRRQIYGQLCARAIPARGRQLANEPTFEVYSCGPRGPQTRLHVPLA